MPVKVTSVQTRPNKDVEWYVPEKLNGSLGNLSLGNDPTVIESSEEVSADGLVKIKTFLFPDGFDVEQHAEDGRNEYRTRMKEYLEDNGITIDVSAENV